VKSSESCGLLTAADAGYFSELCLLLRSLMVYPPCPVAVYDLGLTEHQRSALSAGGVTVMPPSCEVTKRQRPGRCDWKPWVIAASPFEVTAWVDADVIFLANPAELLAFGRNRLAVFAHVGDTTIHTGNPVELYACRPVPVRPSALTLNAGVLVTSRARVRDRMILDAWQGMVDQAASDASLDELVRYADQGALLWALHAADALDSIITDLRWNRSADGYSEVAGAERRTYVDDALLEQLRTAHPGMALLHWWGRPKLSELLGCPT
jgi:hypothetical protein